MRHVAFVVPGSLDTRTGGSIYNRRLVDGLRRRGRAVTVIEVPPPFPYPTADGRASAARALSGLEDGAIVVVDSLVVGAMPDLVFSLAHRARVVALEHLPLGSDPGLPADARRSFEMSERRALGAAAHVVVTGAAALPLLEPYGLRPGRVSIVEPGTDPRELSAPWSAGPVELLAVGTVNHVKGYDVLMDALAQLTTRDWRLTCAGSLERDPATAARVRAVASALGLEAHVRWRGDLDAQEVDTCYRRAQVFVTASRRETYGMAVADALAHGLPVVTTRTGAAPDLVGTEAGIVVPADDAGALADALGRVLSDASLRERLAAGARRQRDRLPSWDEAVSRFVDVLDTLAPTGPHD